VSGLKRPKKAASWSQRLKKESMVFDKRDKCAKREQALKTTQLGIVAGENGKKRSPAMKNDDENGVGRCHSANDVVAEGAVWEIKEKRKKRSFGKGGGCESLNRGTKRTKEGTGRGRKPANSGSEQ